MVDDTEFDVMDADDDRDDSWICDYCECSISGNVISISRFGLEFCSHECSDKYSHQL